MKENTVIVIQINNMMIIIIIIMKLINIISAPCAKSLGRG